MGVESFLKEKRQYQETNTKGCNLNTIAPSGRHDINRMGGYNLQSGQFTGNGPDGMLQPEMPTQRRIANNGQRYVADEGEVVVVDAQTLQDYGGAEALDSFIQQHRPKINGQQATSNNQVSRPRVIDKQQLDMLDDVKKGVEQFQEGGVPGRNRTIEQISPKTPDFGGRINPRVPGQGPGGSTSATQNFTPRTPINPNLAKTNLLKDPNKKTDPIIPQLDPLNIPDVMQTTPLDIADINVPQQGDVNINPLADPIVGKTPFDLQKKKTFTPTKTDFDLHPEGTTPTQPTKPPVVSPSDYDEMLLNRYATRQGAMNEAERAAEAQRGMQAGLSDRETMGRGAISDVSRRSALGETVSDFAMDAARRGEERDKFQQEMSLKEKQMNLAVNSQEFDQAMTQAMIGIKAGDYKGVNKILSDMGLNNIDFDKIQSIEDANTVIGGIDNIIAGLGPDADPKLLAFLGGLKGQVLSKSWKNMGIDPKNMTFTDDQGNPISLQNFIESIDSDTTDPNTLSNMIKIGDYTKTWLDETPAGEIFSTQLSSTTIGQELMDKVMDGDAPSSEILGELVGAAFAQDMGKKLTSGQKDILKKYDLYDEDLDIGSLTMKDVHPAINSIKRDIKAGKIEDARKTYDALTAEEKELVGSFEDYTTEGLGTQEDYDTKLKSLTEGNYDYNVENFPTSVDDPMYKELLTNPHTTQLFDAGDNSKPKQTKHTGKGNNQWYFEELGAKAGHIGMNVKKGEMINYNGKLLIFKKVSLKTKVGPDENEYTFYDPITKKDVVIKTG